MDVTTTGHVSTRVLNEQDLVRELTEQTELLLRGSAAADVGEALRAGIGFELDDADAYAAFRRLTRYGWLAGIGSLPCCATHDQDDVEAYAQRLSSVLDTGRLPEVPGAVSR